MVAGRLAVAGDAGRREAPAALGASVLLHLMLGAAVLGLFGLTRPSPPPAPVAVELVLLRDAPPAEVAEPGAAAAPEPATPAAAPPEPVAASPAAPEPEPAVREAAPPEPLPALAAAAAVPAAAPPRPPRPPPPRPAARPAPARPPQSAEPGSAAASQPLAAPAPPAAPAVSAPEGPPVVTGARFRQRPTPPAYPEMARERGQTGTAVLRALIGPGGETRDIRLHRSSGHALLDGAALQAVRRWLFEPATRDGRPIEAWVEVPVRFVLD